MIEVGQLNFDVLPIDVQLVRDHHGKRGAHALPDFGILRDNRHDSVRRHANERQRLIIGGRSAALRKREFRKQAQCEAAPAERRATAPPKGKLNLRHIHI